MAFVWWPYPVQAGLSAEIMPFGPAEIVVWTEGLIEGGNQVKERLPAALVRQWTFPFISALTVAQPARTHTEKKIIYI